MPVLSPNTGAQIIAMVVIGLVAVGLFALPNLLQKYYVREDGTGNFDGIGCERG